MEALTLHKPIARARRIVDIERVPFELGGGRRDEVLGEEFELGDLVVSGAHSSEAWLGLRSSSVTLRGDGLGQKASFMTLNEGVEVLAVVRSSLWRRIVDSKVDSDVILAWLGRGRSISTGGEVGASAVVVPHIRIRAWSWLQEARQYSELNIIELLCHLL